MQIRKWPSPALRFLKRSLERQSDRHVSLLGDLVGENDVDVEWLITDHVRSTTQLTHWLLEQDARLHHEELEAWIQELRTVYPDP